MFRRGDDERNEPIQTDEVATPPPAAKAGGAAAAAEVTIVGQGARLDGTLVSAGSLRIDGQVKGKIKAEGDVTLSSQSKVDADIEAQNVVVAGQFKGNIVAKAKAELARGGRVEGNVTSKSLVVADGAVFSGQSIMGEVPVSTAAAAAGKPVTATPGREPEPAKTGA
jgi:cytoskeletal protein CcmA (bactofilin family)